SNNTEQIAELIGNNLIGGEIVVLASDLGGGKTVFAKGLARGAGSQDQVSSPTFTISKVYKCESFDLHHFDFYRLNDPGIIALELKEVIGDTQNVIVIEWADIIKNILPKHRMEVIIENEGGDKRGIILNYPAKIEYLVEAIKP
ncbi:MAG: tRNA (adenosine(37)-N6)-threonylcarbamoyltransferase complex ATPase subunit type 1 TsaE, partial [Candidatus Saccharibacteria bacterium]